MSERVVRAKRYHQAIHEVLMNKWDPIGVQGVPEAQDEYDAYVSGVYSRLIRHVERHELFDYLWAVETEHMGLCGDRQRAEHVIDELLKVREQLETAV